MANRILIVDDEPDSREVLAILLGQEGHEVDTVESGVGALHLLGGRSYDVILSDLRMPGGGGEELFRRIERGWPHLAPRVVFVTGQQPSVEFQAQYGNTRVPILTKPVIPKRLRQVIARVMARDR